MTYPIEERDRAILVARARVLAREPVVEDPAARLTIVPFSLGGGTYAVEATIVRKVVDAGSIAHLPGAPAAVFGITTHRGAMIAVIDLRVLFGLTRRPDMAPRLLMLGEREPELALLADAVEDLTEIVMSAVLPPTQMHPLVRGLTAEARLLLHGRALLSEELVSPLRGREA